jgi:hypothetical protein
MEAYCDVVRAVEDKFYGIELNHIPRKYNEEADELTKIASGGLPSPRTFWRGMSPPPPSTLIRSPQVRKNPRGLPRIRRVRSPWTRTPRTRRSCSPCSRGMGQTKPRP